MSDEEPVVHAARDDERVSALVDLGESAALVSLTRDDLDGVDLDDVLDELRDELAHLLGASRESSRVRADGGRTHATDDDDVRDAVERIEQQATNHVRGLFGRGPLCHSPSCQREGSVATPEGALCHDCAEDLAQGGGL